MDFYKILEDIMQQKSISIPDVARMCNLPDSTIRSIISRKSKTVALEVAFKISKGLNVSLEELNGEILKQSDSPRSNNEQEVIKKYRALDEHGKEMVDFTLTKEWERSIALQEQENNLPEESDTTYQPTTLAAHFDGDEYTDDEMDEINQFTEFVKGKRGK